MHNVATPIWNEIADLAESKTWKYLMALNQERQAQAIEEIAAALRSRKVPPMVILSYLEMAPMLQEQHAIQTYLATHPQLRSVFPEIRSAGEAALIAQQDRPLSPSEVKKLLQLLEEPPHFAMPEGAGDARPDRRQPSNDEATSLRNYKPATAEEVIEAYRHGAELLHELMKDRPEPEPQARKPS
ncbi:MAG: hypothetical protein J0L57_00760 [Burkholderiales bacterium]|nr:hypothetical protein [Burkholderiales bacterium]